MSSLEEKKHHEVKLKEGLKGLATKRMELHNSLSSSWPKQVSFFSTFFQIKNTLIYNGASGVPPGYSFRSSAIKHGKFDVIVLIPNLVISIHFFLLPSPFTLTAVIELYYNSNFVLYEL